MMEKEIWELDRLARYATELRDLIADAESMAPERVEATDQSGAIRMAIGRDLQPATITVANDWAERLDPRALGAAVAEAYQACTQQLSAQWSQALEHQGFEDRMERLNQLEAETENGPPPGASGTLPPAFQRPEDFAQTRSLDSLASEMLAAAEAASALVASVGTTPPTQGIGRTRTRTVAIGVSQVGLIGCEVDPAWAARQTGTRLTQALRTALAEAKEEFATAEREKAGAQGHVPQVNALLDEILAKLRDPRIASEE
jgi:hypothetical protein